jgi:hypothetical protein
MMHYVFNVVLRPPIRSCSVQHLESLVGVLMHNSAVMPLLFGTLSELQRQVTAVRNSVPAPSRINLTSASLSELAM